MKCSKECNHALAILTLNSNQFFRAMTFSMSGSLSRDEAEAQVRMKGELNFIFMRLLSGDGYSFEYEYEPNLETPRAIRKVRLVMSLVIKLDRIDSHRCKLVFSLSDEDGAVMKVEELETSNEL